METGHSTGDFARELENHRSEGAQLQHAVEWAVEWIDGCDHAGVMMVNHGAPTTKAATSDLVRECDRLQYDLDEGPCLDTVLLQTTVVSHDLAADRRWLRWGPAVATRYGVNSTLSLLLYTTRDDFGALNLYSESANAYSSEAQLLAEAIATHTALAVSASRDQAHRDLALVNRTVIGQAEGILMERLGIDGTTAFNYLRRVSQQSNTKLFQIAEQLVETRLLPDTLDANL